MASLALCLVGCGDDASDPDAMAPDAGEADGDEMDPASALAEIPELTITSTTTSGWRALGDSALRQGIPLGLLLAESPDERDPERFLRVAGLHMLDGEPLLALPILRQGETEQTPALRVVRWDGEAWTSELVELGFSVVAETSEHEGALRFGVFEQASQQTRIGVGSWSAGQGLGEIDWFGEIESRNVTVAHDGERSAFLAYDWRQQNRVLTLDYDDGEFAFGEFTTPELREFHPVILDGESWLLVVIPEDDETGRRAVLKPFGSVSPDEPSLFPAGYTFAQRLGAVKSEEGGAYIMGDVVRMEGDAGFRERALLRLKDGETTPIGVLPQTWTNGEYAALEVDGELVIAMPFAGPGNQDMRVVVVSSNGQVRTLDRDAPGGGGISNSQDVRSQRPLMAADDQRLCVSWLERNQLTNTNGVRLLCHDLPLP